MTTTGVVPAETWGSRVFRARIHAGLMTAEALGDAIGVSGVTVGNWEKHGTKPRNEAEMARRIAEVTGVDRWWLLFGMEDTEQGPSTNGLPTERLSYQALLPLGFDDASAFERELGLDEPGELLVRVA